MTNLIIFDWDHTLAVPALGETFRKPGEPYKWMEDPERLHSNRCELLEWLHHDGVDIAIATNQGGISYGILTLDETQEAIFALLKDLSFPVPLLICPYHEARPSNYSTYVHWRKPLPGMLQALHSLFPNVPANEVIVVGDREEDQGAAFNAGFQYVDHQAFFDGVEIQLESFIRDEQNADEDFNYLPPTGEPPDLETIALTAEDDDDGPPF